MRSACFPAEEPADQAALARASALAGTLGGRASFVAPAQAARQTAAAMGLEPVVVGALAEADHGRWSGLPYHQVGSEEPEALVRWLADPHAAPHGGESVAAMAARVSAWLESVPPGPSVVVCDAGVIRAALAVALGLGPLATTRFDLAPLSTTELTATRGGWRVAHVNRKAQL